METLFTILVMIAVIVVAAVLFVGWAAMMMLQLVGHGLRTVGRALGGGMRVGNRLFSCGKRDQIRCANPKCGAINPAAARFCRRCGRPMRKTIHVVARRAAVF